MPTVFISYRRDDAAAYAGRLYDGLRERYGEDHVFMDVDRIQPGEDFAAVIQRSVHSADVVLAVIGKTWLTAANASGQPRLDDPDDFVRRELEAALDSGRRLIPVLVGDADMPGEQALPPVLRRLAGVQAVAMSNGRWDYDAERLTRSIDAGGGAATRRRWLWGLGALALAAVALIMLVALPQAARIFSRTVTLRSAPAVVSVDQARALLGERATAAPLELEDELLGADAVVKAALQRLMWQRGASPRSFDRAGAEHYVQELNTRGFAGYTDWRLPTLEEAMGLMGSGSVEDCRLHRLFARSGPIMRTADSAEGGKDWVVYFCEGTASPEVEAFNAQVRAVRTLR